MAEPAPLAGASPAESGPTAHGTRCGIVVSGFPPGSHVDQDTLTVAFFKAVKGDMKCGIPEMSSCHFTEDMQRAYVEFVDPAGERYAVRMLISIKSCTFCVCLVCVLSVIVISTSTMPLVCDNMVYGIMICHCSCKLYGLPFAIFVCYNVQWITVTTLVIIYTSLMQPSHALSKSRSSFPDTHSVLRRST